LFAGFYPQYLDKTCLMQFDSRDISFPVKYDLSPSRHRIPTNHVVVKKDEPPSALHLKRQSAIVRTVYILHFLSE